MKSLAEHMSFYYHYHRKKATQYTHMIGIPLVIFSMFLVLNWIYLEIPNVFHLSLMWVAIILTILYYVILDWVLAGAMLLLFTLLAIPAMLLTPAGPSWLSFKIFVITFIIGWVFQLVGHLIEGKRPALMANLFQAIIGPIFIMAEVFFMLGYKKGLQAKVEQLSNER